MNTNLLSKFMEKHNYDIRQTGNGRWIDQKCALDSVCFVADCIVEHIHNGGKQPFQSPDIWRSEYAVINVQRVFGKPYPLSRSTTDEYNKFYRQPMKLLAAAGVLKEDGKVRNTIQFSVENADVLEYIAMRERNSFDFLCLYIEKTLRDSGLWDGFETFFDEQTQSSLENLRNAFMHFCFKYTPIEKELEPNRIFIKVLNHLACLQHKKGTIKGRISRSMITYDKIVYNKTNWRDDLAGKDKNIARGDYAPLIKSEDVYNYRVTRVMKYLKKFNNKYNDGKSEVLDRFSVGEIATYIHHIFPRSQYEEIADYIENLIALTGAQHYQRAHPNGDTHVADKEFQYQCLISKTESIRKNILDNRGEPIIYSFEDFMYVLDTGLRTDYFGYLSTYDFNSVLTGIEMNY